MGGVAGEDLDTGDGKRDRDLNKSMESNKYPTMRFDLAGVAPGGGARRHRVRAPARQADAARRDPRGDPPGAGGTIGETLRLRSDFPLDLGDYKIGGLTKMLGMLRMQEGIEVHVDLTFAPR